MVKAELKKNYWRIRLVEPSEFEAGTFKTHDVGRTGHAMRVAAVKKSTGKWATQSWRLAKDDVRVSRGTLAGIDPHAKKIIQSIRANAGKIHVKSHKRR